MNEITSRIDRLRETSADRKRKAKEEKARKWGKIKESYPELSELTEMTKKVFGIDWVIFEVNGKEIFKAGKI